MEYELVKVVCQAVIARREDGKIMGEEESSPLACYTAEQTVAFWDKIQAEIDEQNASMLEGPTVEVTG